MDSKTSFTSANTIPIKLMSNLVLCEQIKEHRIPPYHVQLIPTNRCSLHCSFCSCENRNRKQEQGWSDLVKKINKLIDLGMKAVTITGGGEPLLYPEINELIHYLSTNKIEIGLVTNGTVMDNLADEQWRRVKWCRISVSDESPIDIYGLMQCKDIPIDWAFSYVLLQETNIVILRKVIEFANQYNFTHIRLVDDILDGEDNQKIEEIKEWVDIKNIDGSRIVFQGRKQYGCGNGNCYVSLLKPVLAADGNIYACCGLQYAREVPDLDYNEDISMGNDIEKIYKEQKYFNGSICKKCYYGEYNQVMDALWNSKQIKHKEHV